MFRGVVIIIILLKKNYRWPYLRKLFIRFLLFKVFFYKLIIGVIKIYLKLVYVFQV